MYSINDTLRVRLLAHALESDAGHLNDGPCTIHANRQDKWCKKKNPYATGRIVNVCSRPRGHKGPHIACFCGAEKGAGHYNEIWV